MKKLSFLFISIFIILIFISCVSGTSIVTGTVRTPIEPSDVKLYSEFPENYEVIAIVTASSEDGYNYVIEELKKQAAKNGANGVVIENLGESKSSGFYTYGIFIQGTKYSITGKAIFVEE